MTASIAMHSIQQHRIEPLSAMAFTVRQGQGLRITDVEGGQPGDLIAFNLHALAEKFSQARTRVENRNCRLTTGGTLWTNAIPPRVMLTILADAGGPHDLLYTPCCRYALERRFGVSRDGCYEHLARAVAPWGIAPPDMPDPFNLFFAVRVDSDGALSIGEHASPPGAFIDLRAELDVLVAVSTCSAPHSTGRPNTGYRVDVLSPSGTNRA